MSETTSPLSLVARGVPVAGEPVTVHDAARRGSSLTPAQRQAGEGRLLWVTGFTLAPSEAFDGPQARAMNGARSSAAAIAIASQKMASMVVSS